MLTTLTAAPAQAPDRSLWGLSITLHTGLIGLALWWTQSLPGAREDPRDETRVIFWPVPHRPGTAPPEHPIVRGEHGPAFTLPIVSPVLPPLEEPPAPGWPTTAVDPFPGEPGPGLPAVTEPPSPPPAVPMDVRTVEEPPVLLSHPAPGYPELLRRAGVEGRVVVEAVLDSTGRAEHASLRIVSSTHGLFAPEAAALVLGSRYRPARFGGHPVRVRIQVPVTFALRR